MKNKNVIIWCCIGLSFILSVISIVLVFLLSDNTKSTTDIYNECIYNVVEVKAQSEDVDVGESFGTGEIISSDGKIVTNAHTAKTAPHFYTEALQGGCFYVPGI